MTGLLSIQAATSGSISGTFDRLTPEHIRAVIRPLILKAGAEFVDYTRGMMGSSGSPSAPGAYPGIVSGALAGSLAYNVYGDGLHVNLTAGVNYARYLEGGTYKMDRRPFMEPSLDVIGDKFEAMIRSAIAGL